MGTLAKISLEKLSISTCIFSAFEHVRAVSATSDIGGGQIFFALAVGTRTGHKTTTHLLAQRRLLPAHKIHTRANLIRLCELIQQHYNHVGEKTKVET